MSMWLSFIDCGCSSILPVREDEKSSTTYYTISIDMLSDITNFVVPHLITEV